MLEYFELVANAVKIEGWKERWTLGNVHVIARCFGSLNILSPLEVLM